ncbi:MAG: hypothetical protein IKM43_02935 [Clostridia bacterium]|nr:hypothetical protein [Clostridia bacterium]
MENMEQPNQKDLGSTSEFGKFKDAESLLKAYSNLEAEFTKKSQRLATLETEQNEYKQQAEKRAEQEKKVEDFVTKFEIAKPFSSALKETLANNQDVDIKEEAIKLISNNYKTAQDYVSDDEFLNNYIYSNQTIKDKIVKEYLSNVTQNTPIKMQTSANFALTPPKQPTTIQEAGRLAKSIIKQK